MKCNPFRLGFLLLWFLTLPVEDVASAATYKNFKNDKIQLEYPAAWSTAQKADVITFTSNKEEVLFIRLLAASFDAAAEEAGFVRVGKEWRLLGRHDMEGEAEEISHDTLRGLIGEAPVGMSGSFGFGLGFATVAMLSDDTTSAIFSGEAAGSEEGDIILKSVRFTARTQGDMQDDACGAFKKADVELNRTYKKILSQYNDDKRFLDKLKKAQKAWLVYRDAHIEAVFPAEDKAGEYGSVYGMCHCAAMKDLTEQRTKMLKQWLVGIREGEVCSGSIKVR